MEWRARLFALDPLREASQGEGGILRRLKMDGQPMLPQVREAGQGGAGMRGPTQSVWIATAMCVKHPHDSYRVREYGMKTYQETRPARPF